MTKLSQDVLYIFEARFDLNHQVKRQHDKYLAVASSLYIYFGEKVLVA